jgi:hypothetical protein
VKFALLAPTGMVTLAGTRATAVLLVDRITTAPPAGAAPVNVAVPVELFPPTTDLGVRVTEDKTAAFTVRVAVRVAPRVPEMITDVFEDTETVPIVKVLLMDPAGIVTLDGTWATEGLLL